MICGHCTHWQLIDMQQIADGVKRTQHIGRCRLHRVGRNRISSCDQWEREPGADDDQGEYGEGAAFKVDGYPMQS